MLSSSTTGSAVPPGEWPDAIYNRGAGHVPYHGIGPGNPSGSRAGAIRSRARTSSLTWWPCPASAATVWQPTYPLPPVTSTRIDNSPRRQVPSILRYGRAAKLRPRADPNGRTYRRPGRQATTLVVDLPSRHELVYSQY